MEAKNIPWELIIAQFKKEISDGEQKELSDWLSVDANRELFEELDVLWQKIQAKVVDYTPDTAYYWKELTARMAATSQEKEKEEPVVRKRLTLFGVLYRYAAVACLVLVSVVGLSYYMGATLNRQELAGQTFQNLSGKSKVRLPDGTDVWLHSNTILSYDGDFLVDDRSVHLSGEAYFEVTSDKKRPFKVQTADVSVVVHGTKFNVDAPVGSDESTVSLVEGSVSLETAIENQFLKPGETAVYSTKSRRLNISQGDVLFDKSWANEQLQFANRPLGDVCRQLSKWYGVTIHVDPTLTDRYRYTFMLRNEPLEEILRILSRINPIAYSFDEENVLTITPH